MEVVVDGKTGLMTPDAGTTFQAYLEALRRNMSSRRRVIVSFTLDGEKIDPDNLGVKGAQPPGDFGLLEVKTADPFLFSVGTLSGLLTHLKNMEKSQEDALQFAAAGEYAKTLEKADACFYGWDILLRAVRDVGTLTAADLKNLDAGGVSVDARIRELQDALLRYAAAMEFKDVARIAELIQTEFRLRLHDWRTVIEALGRHVAKTSST
ncbi:MAG TPA: hypothetical protein VG457_12520 [Planctomycetota bacterium]|jgi:hypothetical protein|nr:hypothetical protein [Planctomycetota bacterium]